MPNNSINQLAEKKISEQITLLSSHKPKNVNTIDGIIASVKHVLKSKKSYPTENHPEESITFTMTVISELKMKKGEWEIGSHS